MAGDAVSSLCCSQQETTQSSGCHVTVPARNTCLCKHSGLLQQTDIPTLFFQTLAPCRLQHQVKPVGRVTADNTQTTAVAARMQWDETDQTKMFILRWNVEKLKRE